MHDPNAFVKSHHKLSIAIGAGRPVAVAPSAVAQFAGQSVVAALSRIIAEHVKDPDLLSALHGPHPAIELSFQVPSGKLEETPLAPTDGFQRVLDVLESADAELGISSTHIVGGVSCP